jgi:hypothetical protein
MTDLIANDPDDICPKTLDGKHVPDWSSVTSESDGGEWYVDIPCVACGRSGCVGNQKQLESGITW